MGANKNSDRQICGNIFINMKTIKNKNKVFTFHCAFCSTECDQLKKFSKHLEEHWNRFEDGLEHEKCPNLLFEPEEIKVEERLDMQIFDERYNKSIDTTTSSAVYEDPLETGKLEKSLIKNMSDSEESVLRNVKNKKEECVNTEDEICDVSNVASSIQETDTIIEESAENSYIFKDLSSDELSDDSNDADFDQTKTSGSPLNKKKVTKKSSETNKSKKRRRTIYVKILPSLIQLYKKYEILWKVDNIAFGIKNKKNEIYMKIVDDIKLEHDVNISIEEMNYHINYLNELYSKDKDKELICKMEKKEFVPEHKYYAEMSFLSDSQGPFLCTICNEKLPKYDSYCQHMAQHNGTQPFKCPSCDVTFSNYHKYLIHKKRHLGIYNFHCDICGKGYLFKNDLEWHVTSHTGDKPYLCQICGTGFRARHGYDNHIRRHEERFRHECHICKRGFNQLHALNNHVKSHLNIRDIICKICGKGFVHNKYLKRHQLIHGEVKNYKCNECGKAFFQACGLRAHRKNHHS
ncbi:zinc finger protein 845-like [Lucilia sericata]|uniref:zinc finger protein 845-like n=1 Tax=Lucilia sericata TaxID=13632 RepID=UPI0018A868F5|nr:zinc finger protein 845-like [Lucilia sericata]